MIGHKKGDRNARGSVRHPSLAGEWSCLHFLSPRSPSHEISLAPLQIGGCKRARFMRVQFETAKKKGWEALEAFSGTCGGGDLA